MMHYFDDDDDDDDNHDDDDHDRDDDDDHDDDDHDHGYPMVGDLVVASGHREKTALKLIAIYVAEIQN